MKVGIIGAGPAGLAAAAALKAKGIPFDIIDAGRMPGGIWDIGRAQTPMYEAAHFISSKSLSAFPGFPMPESYPDYPRHDQVLAYIRSFADHHDLTRHIRFNTRVTSATRSETGWRITTDAGEIFEWPALVVATGVTWHPHTPEVPGAFDGEQLHAFDFKSPDVFRGKRVLVAGGGNSGADIACEAARQASKAFLSLRRGYYFIPKYLFGKPADVFAHGGPHLPPWLEEKVFGFLMNHVVVGDLTRFGLPKPDHPILQSHPIMNTQVLHYLGHGDLACRADVKALRGKAVEFVDGRQDDVDLIVWATGYRRVFPFLDDSDAGGKRDLYLELFDRRHPDLFLMGLFETDGAAYGLFGQQAELIAEYLYARRARPEAAQRFDVQRASARPDLRGGRAYLQSRRHDYYVKSDVYSKVLASALTSLRA